MMRLFIAIDLSDKVLNYVKKIQDEIDDSIGNFSKPKPENSHITVKFLGDVEEEDVDSIRERLRDVEFRPFSASTSSFGVFPNEKYIRVFWLGVEDGGEVAELVERVNEALPEFKQDYKFHAHITLARVKFLEDKEKFIDMIKGLKRKDIEFTVEFFKLMSSKLSPKGAKYETIETFS